MRTVKGGRCPSRTCLAVAILTATVLPQVFAPRPLGAQEKVASPSFSVGRGFFETPSSVALATQTPDATIRYTTDGSCPLPTHGTIYTSPIMISQTTVVRARAFRADLAPSDVVTHSYIFLQQVIRQPAQVPGWPTFTIWAGGTAYAPHDYEMDPAIVDHPAYRDVIIGGLKSIPTMSLVMEFNDFWETYGGDVENSVSVEIIYPDHAEKNEQVDCGLAPHSHNRLKRSMRLQFKREYGPGKFETEFLRHAPLHGDSAVREVDRLALRAGNNRSWARIFNEGRVCYTRDQWYRDSQIALSGLGSRGATATS